MNDHLKSQPSLSKSFSIGGMDCIGCAQKIEKVLNQRGFSGLKVSFQEKKATFPEAMYQHREEIKATIQSLGYSISETDLERSGGSKNVLTLLSLLFTLPLLAHMGVDAPLLHSLTFQFFCSTVVLLIGVTLLGKNALGSLWNRSLNMNVLVMIGALSSYLYSVYSWLIAGQTHLVFFETTATIITFVLLGHFVEDRALKKTSEAAREVSASRPLVGRRLEKNGEITEVSAEDLRVNDTVLIETGAKVPADIQIVEGDCLADESLLTGESNPLMKKTGDSLYGGTLIVSGTIRGIVTRTGSDSLLGNIIDLVNNAESSKPKIQKIGDAVSAIFIPVILILSALTFTIHLFLLHVSFHDSFLRALAVLVIACPCAMGLATPTAIVVAVGAAVKRGILIKDGEVLERFSQIKKIFFDKTGTLTSGIFQLESVITYSDLSKAECQDLLVAISKFSQHPISRSLSELPTATTHQIKNTHEIRGTGITGEWDNKKIQVGSAKILPANTSVEKSCDLYLIIDGELSAGFNIRDTIKEDAPGSVEFFRSQGIATAIISGDTNSKVSEVASTLKIEEFYAQQHPEDKLTIIQQANTQEICAYIGDGSNDAPTLAAASIGVSLGTASPLALTSSSVIILSSDLKKVVDLYGLSQKTLRTIKQNLFWAFFYNLLLIPLAATGYVSPTWAALVMGLSDVFVVGNSLRLKYALR